MARFRSAAPPALIAAWIGWNALRHRLAPGPAAPLAARGAGGAMLVTLWTGFAPKSEPGAVDSTRVA
jgi:hypothetical protein